jgi:hypothetical protein
LLPFDVAPLFVFGFAIVFALYDSDSHEDFGRMAKVYLVGLVGGVILADVIAALMWLLTVQSTQPDTSMTGIIYSIVIFTGTYAGAKVGIAVYDKLK